MKPILSSRQAKRFVQRAERYQAKLPSRWKETRGGPAIVAPWDEAHGWEEIGICLNVTERRAWALFRQYPAEFNGIVWKEGGRYFGNAGLLAFLNAKFYRHAAAKHAKVASERERKKKRARRSGLHAVSAPHRSRAPQQRRV